MGYAEEFRDHYRQVRSVSTAECYYKAAKNFNRISSEKGWELHTLPNSAAQEYVIWLQQQRRNSPATVKLRYNGMLAYLKWLHEYKGLEVCIPREPILPRKPKQLPAVPDEKTVGLLILEAAKEKEPYRTAMLLMPVTGLRIAEMVRLQLDQLDPNHKGSGMVVFRPMGKGSKQRAVPMLKEGQATLYQYLTGWRAHKYPKSPWLFPAARGGGTKPINKDGLGHRVQLCYQRAGLDPTTAHALRRFYATRLRDEFGLDISEISRVLGHESINTTMVYLGHRVDDIITHMQEDDA